MSVQISVIMPVYNEEESLAHSYARLTEVLSGMQVTYEIICINDGSKDRSVEIITDLAARDDRVKLVSFSRNFGHQLAVSAGLKYASGEAIVIIDADLQDPPEIIPGMYAKWQEGYEVVYGKRLSRSGETFFKLFTAKMFYKVINALTGHMVPMDSGDFRLIDRKVADTMNAMPEHARFLRGMGSWVGFRQYAYEYERDERYAGQTKYTLKKMLKLAADGILSFSSAPLAVPYWLGTLFSLGGLAWFIVSLCLSARIPAWNITVSAVLTVGGVILLCMGIIGTYLGRIYDEAKGRPLYVIAKTIGLREDE